MESGIETDFLIAVVEDDRLTLYALKSIGSGNGNTRLHLGYTEKALGTCNGMLIMGDDDELAGTREVLEDSQEVSDIPVIKGSIKLIKDAERGRLDLVRRK